MVEFEPYFDAQGCLVNLSINTGDGGDTAHNLGMYRFGKYLENKHNKERLAKEGFKFENELDMLEDPERKNWYRRHPNPGQWWSRSDNFTRDQQRPLVIAMGALKRRKRLCGIFWEHIKRGGFYQNSRHPDPNRGPKLPDFAAPNHWGEYLRAFYMAGFKFLIVLYPLLLITDVFMHIGMLLNRKKWKNPDHADDDNMIMSYTQAAEALPTPISWYSRRWYTKNRPLAGYVDTMPLRNTNATIKITGPASAMAWKHRSETGAPPFYTQWKPILDERFKF